MMGGSHATACVDETLKYFDSVMLGEAEDLWENVISDLEKKELKRIYKAENRPDLKKLVIPRFDLLDYNKYEIPPFAKTPCIPLQTTRGCPNSCDFCSVTAFLGHRIRKKPVENVIREIESLQSL